MGDFFALVKSFDANTDISANFVLTVKNSNDSFLHGLSPDIKNMMESVELLTWGTYSNPVFHDKHRICLHVNVVQLFVI